MRYWNMDLVVTTLQDAQETLAELEQEAAGEKELEEDLPKFATALQKIGEALAIVCELERK